LQGSTSTQTGYGENNLLNLFCYLKTDLKGFDFSSLAIHQAYPLNTVLPDTDYTNAQINQTILAETFGGIVSIAFSPNGQYLASISDDCRVKLWEVETGQCLYTYEDHTSNTYT
jgi:WD40 repeat protein